MDLKSLSTGSSPNNRHARSPSTSSQTELHRCKWLDCTIIFTEANDLYEHITSTHIGRKSAGNLSLDCKWTGCTAKASKRDHLTSHVRVHINLKPHTCPTCSKSFKRPQDLKKHEKIHTEEHHRDHKQSKAVTVGARGKKAAPVETLSYEPSPSTTTNLSSSASYSSWSPPHNYNFQLPPPPMYAGMPFGPDLAQIVAQQQQLNAQAAHAAATNHHHQTSTGPYPNLAAYNFSTTPAYSPIGTGGTSTGSTGLNPYPNLPPPYLSQPLQSLGFSGPPNPFSFPPSHLQAFLPSTSPSYALPLTTPLIIPGSSTAGGVGIGVGGSGNSLYPSLPPNFAFYPTVQAPPDFTPTQPFEINESRIARSVHSASVSPRNPSLSPLSINNTPSPEGHERRLSSGSGGSATSGRKRGFEEAAGDFLGDLRKKNFRESDLDSELDTLSNFLISTGDILPPLSCSDSGRSVESTSPPSIDYSPAEVESINELLLSLGQNLHSPAHSHHSNSNSNHDNNSLRPTSYQSDHAVGGGGGGGIPRSKLFDQPLSYGGHSIHSNIIPGTGGSSMYPSLTEYEPLSNYRRLSYDTSNGSNNNILLNNSGSTSNHHHHLLGGIGSAASGSGTGAGGGGISINGIIQSNKSTAPPTILENETRIPMYRHVERLMKVAPPLSTTSLRRASIEMEEDLTKPSIVGIGGPKYSASLRSTSLDSVDSNSTSGYNYHSSTTSSSSSRSTLLSGSNNTRTQIGPLLNPISSTSTTSIPTTLPSIRALIDLPTINTNTTIDTTIINGSSNLYPIIASPTSSIAKLVHGVNSIGMNNTHSHHTSLTSTILTEEPMEMESEEMEVDELDELDELDEDQEELVVRVKVEQDEEEEDVEDSERLVRSFNWIHQSNSNSSSGKSSTKRSRATSIELKSQSQLKGEIMNEREGSFDTTRGGRGEGEEEIEIESSTSSSKVGAEEKLRRARRLYVIKALVVYVNEAYRKSLIKKEDLVAGGAGVGGGEKKVVMTRVEEVKMEVV